MKITNYIRIFITAIVFFVVCLAVNARPIPISFNSTTGVLGRGPTFLLTLLAACPATLLLSTIANGTSLWVPWAELTLTNFIDN